MAKRVDVRARRAHIAAQALGLFAAIGYEKASFSRIADEAGVARTVLYRHFRNKREILDEAIRAHTAVVAEHCALAMTRGGTVAKRLEWVLFKVTDILFARKDCLRAIFDFVLAMARAGEDMGARILEFTPDIRRTLRALVEEGKACGEFAAWIDPDDATEGFYSQFELISLRIVLGSETSSKVAKKRFSGLIRAMRRPA